MKTIQKLSDKYYSYQPGEFLAIRVDGKVANMAAFHRYKFRKAFTPVVDRLLDTI